MNTESTVGLMPALRDRSGLRRFAILLPVIIALGFRLWGIGWAAPERIDLHPDEHDYVIKHALHVTWTDFDPKFLNYPSFLCYSTALTNGLLKHMGIVREEWQTYIVGRSIVAVYGALTCAAVFLLAEELEATLIAAFLAALWVSVLPEHVWESHVAVTDVVMTFWVIVALYMSVRLIRRSRPVDYLLAGTALGLAVGSKYTAALAGIAPLVAVVAGKRNLGKSLRGFALLGLSALAACFAVTPYTFIRFRDFLMAMAYENMHVHSHHKGFSLPAFGPQYHRYLYQILAAWPFSFGMVLYLSATIGIVWAIWQWKKEHAVVLLFTALYFAVTGSWTLTPLRYYLPLLVIGALFAGLWQGDWLRSPDRWKRGIAGILVAATFSYTVAFTYSTTRRYANDTRVQAAAWLREQGTLSKNLLLVGGRHYLAFLPGKVAISHYEGILSRKGGTARKKDFIEITSLNYLRWYRNHDENYMPMYQRFRDGLGDYVLLKRFEADFLNKKMYSALDPMFESYFISPTLEFYRRKDAVFANAGVKTPRL